MQLFQVDFDSVSAYVLAENFAEANTKASALIGTSYAREKRWQSDEPEDLAVMKILEIRLIADTGAELDGRPYRLLT